MKIVNHDLRLLERLRKKTLQEETVEKCIPELFYAITATLKGFSSSRFLS
ncbi:hypothetical protein [Peribacillus butanolivorans]